MISKTPRISTPSFAGKSARAVQRKPAGNLQRRSERVPPAALLIRAPTNSAQSAASNFTNEIFAGAALASADHAGEFSSRRTGRAFDRTAEPDDDPYLVHHPGRRWLSRLVHQLRDATTERSDAAEAAKNRCAAPERPTTGPDRGSRNAQGSRTG